MMARIYHPWHKWECYKAGFYSTSPPNGMTSDEARTSYANFLADKDRFKSALYLVVKEWTYSCDQFLSNDQINRIAWLGQASMCIATSVPSIYRAGFKLLSVNQQREANALADNCLQSWIKKRVIDEGEDRKIYIEMGQSGLFGRHTG